MRFANTYKVGAMAFMLGFLFTKILPYTMHRGYKTVFIKTKALELLITFSKQPISYLVARI